MPQGTLTSDQPIRISDSFLPSSKLMHCNHVALQTQPKEASLPSLTSVTLQGRGKAQQEDAEA